jgi:drug/metabolite transporter (DMT)-like permease
VGISLSRQHIKKPTGGSGENMTRNQANSLLLFAALLWGAGNVAQQTILENIGPFWAVGLRCLIAGLVILPFSIRNKPDHRILDMPGRTLGVLVTVTFAGAVIFQQIGFGYTSVTNAGFIVNTTTVMTPLVTWFLLLQKPPAIVWPAALTTVIGATLMSGGALKGFNIGDVFCAASAICYSFWMVFLGAFVSQYGNAARLTLAQFAVSGLICVMLGLCFETMSLARLHAALPELLMLGVLSTGAAYLLQSIAQQHTSASEAAIITSGEAIFGAAAAFFMLGETLTTQSGFGAAMMSAGILMIQVPTRFLQFWGPV